MACSARSLSQRSLSRRSLSQPSLRFDSWISSLTPALARANAPLRIRPCRCRGTRILHGRACRAMPRPLLRPKLASPAWPPPTTDLADPARAGLTVSTRSPGVLSAELARPSRGRRVVRDNDSCSPLRRITPAAPPPRAAAISASLSMPCCHAGTSDGTTSHHATPPATTLHVTPPPRRREQAPARSPHPKCGMVLMGAHPCATVC